MQKISGQKILYVIPYFVPAWSYGGPVKVSFDFAKELISLGYSVTVATTDVLSVGVRNKKLREKIDGIEVIRFKNINNKLARNSNLYLPIGFNKWLKKNINNYDLVHIHEFFTYQTMITSRVCRKLQKPYIIQPHGSLSQFCRASRFSFIKNLIINQTLSLVESSSAVIALNEAEKKDIAKIFPHLKSKIKILPNGINPDEFKAINKIDLHKSYDISQNAKIIAFIGRIHFKKGLDISLKALARLKDKFNFKFLIIGPDEGEKSNLEKLAKELGVEDRIIFTGLMSGHKKFETLKSADLSLLNSRSEGLPTTLLESAALGLPIVCSEEANFPEVKEFDAGYVTHGEQETTQAIKVILEDDQLRKKLSQNALKLAENFNLKKCTQRLINIYNQGAAFRHACPVVLPRG